MSKEAEFLIKGSPFCSVKLLRVFLHPLDESIAGYSSLKKKQQQQTILLIKECFLLAEGCDK